MNFKYSITLFFIVKPFIIKETFIHCLIVKAPESFTVCVEFVVICMDFVAAWEFGGSLITGDSNHAIVTLALGNSRYATCIKITQSSEADAGTYTVTVTTASGADSADISIEVIGKF